MSLWRRLLYSPFLVQLVVIRRCNLSCGYCNEYDDESPPVSTELLKARIDKLVEIGAFSLEFTGGEPMLHPEIEELVAYARKRLARVMMISNAYLLTEDRVRALNDAGLTHLQVSVDGDLPNDVTVKVLKPLRGKLAMLARVARFRVTLSGVIGSAEPKEALAVVDFAKEHGFVPRVLLIHGPDGKLRLSPEERAAYREVNQRIGRRFNEARDYRTRLIDEGEAPFKCRAGSRYLYVDEHGLVHWCSQQMTSFAKPLADYSWAELEQQFHTPKGCNPTCTVGCARTNSAADEWRAQRLPAPPLAPPPPDLVQLRTR